VYAVGTSHGAVLIFGKGYLSGNLGEHFLHFVFLCTDKKEQLKSVLTPYQKGQAVDSKLILYVAHKFYFLN